MAERITFRVTPKGNQWQVVPARAGAAALYADKDRAVREASGHAREIQPSRVVIYTRGGAIETEYTFENEPIQLRRRDRVGWSQPPGRLVS